MYIEGLDIPNCLNPEDAIVQSEEDGMSHTAWINESTGLIIAAEFSEYHGTAILVYENIDEYLEEFEDTWILEKNTKKDKLNRVGYIAS